MQKSLAVALHPALREVTKDRRADREPLFSVDYRLMVLAVLPLFCRANGASDKLRDQNQKEAPQFRGRLAPRVAPLQIG